MIEMDLKLMCPVRGCNYYLEDSEDLLFVLYEDQEAESRGIESGHHYTITYKCPGPECGRVYHRIITLHQGPAI